MGRRRSLFKCSVDNSQRPLQRRRRRERGGHSCPSKRAAVSQVQKGGVITFERGGGKEKAESPKNDPLPSTTEILGGIKWANLCPNTCV